MKRLILLLLVVALVSIPISVLAHTEANPQTTILYAGQNINVGNVLVWNDGSNLYVKYQLNSDWKLAETHLAISDDPSNIPQNKNRNPTPGHFPYSEDHTPWVSNYTYTIPLAPWVVGTDLVIAAHAVVVKADGTETMVTLNYIGRSLEAGASVATGATQGSEVNDALTLPIDPEQTIWNDGEYQEKNPPPPAGVEYATWDQWNAACRGDFEARRFNASFDLPSGVDPKYVSDVILYDAHDYGLGDIIPINDNLYVFLNKNLIGTKGTGYPGALRDIPTLPQTDGWYVLGSFGMGSAQYLQSGTNELDLIAEEYCNWGGMDKLNLKLMVNDHETAWGSGTTFPGNNWATYFDYTIQ